MKRLRDFTIDDLGGGITAIDLGASGPVNPEWRPIAHWLNVIGFDPNEAECDRLNAQLSGYRSARFLPYALAGETGPHTLYKTRSIYCWSLLKPRLDDWLSRFTYADLFEPDGTDTVQAFRLDEVLDLSGSDLDAIKVDTQGLELPILRGALPFVRNCISVETETGFTENYEGETTFDEILAFMRGEGFGLFGIDPYHAVARRNALSRVTRNEQLLWTEALWLRDFHQSSPAQLKVLTRAKALRALCIYANHGCLAFGLETARLFHDLGLLTSEEIDAANDPRWWRLPGRSPGLVRAALNWMPRKMLGSLRLRLISLITTVDAVKATPHPLGRKSS